MSDFVPCQEKKRYLSTAAEYPRPPWGLFGNLSPRCEPHGKVLFVGFLESGPPCITTTTGGWCHLHEISIFATGTGAQQNARNPVSGHGCGLHVASLPRLAVPLALLHIPLPPHSSSNELFSLWLQAVCALCVCSLLLRSLSRCLSVWLAFPCDLERRVRQMMCALRSPHFPYLPGVALIF